MLSLHTLTDKANKSNSMSIYLKGLGWIAGNSVLRIYGLETDISITNRNAVYNLIDSFNVPYTASTIEFNNHRKDATINEQICFNPSTDEELIQYKKLVSKLSTYAKNNEYEKWYPIRHKRIPHLANLLGLYGLSKDVLADEIILTLKNKDDNFIKTYQVIDYLEDDSCKHLSNKVCLNYARGLMINELSKDLVNYIITSDYEANADVKIELEVEASMVTLSGEKEFTRITKFTIDEGFLPEILHYATKYNAPTESAESNNEQN